MDNEYYLIKFLKPDGNHIEYGFRVPAGMSETWFKHLCESSIEKAALRALQRNDHEWVTWKDVMEELVPLLEHNSIYPFEPKQVTYEISADIIFDHEELDTSNVPSLGEAKALVVRHNVRVQKEKDGDTIRSYCRCLIYLLKEKIKSWFS